MPSAQSNSLVAIGGIHVHPIEIELVELAAHITAATYRFLVLLREFDEIEGWHATGARSYAHWLSWRCGIGLNTAREKLRVANALKDLPEISDAFRLGVVSYSKVRALTRVATPANESALVMMAQSGTATHVERIARGYRRAQRLQVANDIHARRDLQVIQDADGSVVIKARLPAEAGAIVVKALEAATESVRKEATEPDDFGASRADARARIAESYLANGDAALRGGDTHLVTVQVNPEALRKPENVTAVTCSPSSLKTSRPGSRSHQRPSLRTGTANHRTSTWL